jgi:hypothetical protein
VEQPVRDADIAAKIIKNRPFFMEGSFSFQGGKVAQSRGSGN